LANVKTLYHQKFNNKPQAEGNAYSRVYSKGRSSSSKTFSLAAILDH